MIAMLARGAALGRLAVLASSCLLLLAGWAASAQAAGVPPSLQALADVYRCDLIDRLTRIAAGDRMTSKNRFILVYPRRRPSAYVQCIFVEHDTEMLCEAASGAYVARADRDRPYAPPGDAGRLRALGFAPGQNGNFARRLRLEHDADFGRVADLILRTLHDGFRVSPPERLIIRAPHARWPRPIPAACEAAAAS